MIVGAGEDESIGFIDGQSVDRRVAVAGENVKELEKMEHRIAYFESLNENVGRRRQAMNIPAKPFLENQIQHAIDQSNSKGRRSRTWRCDDSVLQGGLNAMDFASYLLQLLFLLG